MKRHWLLIILFFSLCSYTQNVSTYEKPPVFSECDSLAIAELKSCFNYTLNDFIFKNFQVPQIVSDENYKGNVQVLFEINKEGTFQVLYVDAIYDELKPYEKLEYSSELNIPFTHSYYARFDDEMNAIGTNSHTAAKPFVYSDVARYYNIKAEIESLLKDTDTWFGRKLYN